MTSNTVAIQLNNDPQTVERPSRIAFPRTLSLEVSNFRATTAVHDSLVERIAEIIASYRISGPGDKYKDVMEPKILDTLRSFVAKQEPINMVVPAYPFKSPNRESKVLGPDPDVGDRMSLQHLNSIGARIQQIYPPGGHVTIVSDGLCYNDLLEVSNEEVFDYAQGLHRITKALGLKHLKFTDLFELIDSEKSPTSAEEYASRIEKLRERLIVSFRPQGYNFDKDIKKDNNALLTYRGYMKFLGSDMATFFREKGMSKSATKKRISKTARGMIERGKAFSAMVACKSPLHVRLSIHASDNTDKLSVTLLPQERYSTSPVTPWHNTPYLDDTNGSLSLGRRPTDSDVTYKLCKDDLGLNFLCADVPMYSVIGFSETIVSEGHAKLEPLYPSGLKIQVPKDTPITHFDLNNVMELAKLHSPIIFEGLDPMQCTSEVVDAFHRMVNDRLSLSLLHEAVTPGRTVSKADSSFVRKSTLQRASAASERQAAYYQEEEDYFGGLFGNALQEAEYRTIPLRVQPV